ncbi:hypothetical protein F511_43723 [Dorcoceras hygrometricum]|uniref:Uncharacterized protein n=1 Tax=Dorcoceras hygrometricum TaxID=472368 RepID=A0A2Z7DFA4_9LAMI|nr:hypothetical protein F511_43723 [Dorcoceras hygrometricum]
MGVTCWRSGGSGSRSQEAAEVFKKYCARERSITNNKIPKHTSMFREFTFGDLAPAPTIPQREIVLQWLNNSNRLIRSTIGISNAPLVCTRKKVKVLGTEPPHQDGRNEFRQRHDDSGGGGYPRTRVSGESSTTKHRILHTSGPHPPPDGPKGVGARGGACGELLLRPAALVFRSKGK